MRQEPPRAAVLVALALAILLWAPGTLLAQCAMCKTLLTNSPEGRAIGGRFNLAILVMLFAPYVIASGVFLALFREEVRSRLEGVGTAVRARFRSPESPV